MSKTQSNEVAHRIYLAYRGRPGQITGKALKARIAQYVAYDDAKLDDAIHKFSMFNHANATFSRSILVAIRTDRSA